MKKTFLSSAIVSVLMVTSAMGMEREELSGIAESIVNNPEYGFKNAATVTVNNYLRKEDQSSYTPSGFPSLLKAALDGVDSLIKDSSLSEEEAKEMKKLFSQLSFPTTGRPQLRSGIAKSNFNIAIENCIGILEWRLALNRAKELKKNTGKTDFDLIERLKDKFKTFYNDMQGESYCYLVNNAFYQLVENGKDPENLWKKLEELFDSNKEKYKNDGYELASFLKNELEKMDEATSSSLNSSLKKEQEVELSVDLLRDFTKDIQEAAEIEKKRENAIKAAEDAITNEQNKVTDKDSAASVLNDLKSKLGNKDDQVLEDTTSSSGTSPSLFARINALGGDVDALKTSAGDLKKALDEQETTPHEKIEADKSDSGSKGVEALTADQIVAQVKDHVKAFYKLEKDILTAEQNQAKVKAEDYAKQLRTDWVAQFKPVVVSLRKRLGV